MFINGVSFTCKHNIIYILGFIAFGTYTTCNIFVSEASIFSVRSVVTDYVVCGVVYIKPGNDPNAREVQHAKKTWTQSDIRFCENDWSNRFKISEKGGHLDRKYRRKFLKKMLKIC